MCYIVYPPEIIELKEKIEPYRAKCAEEDRGDGFLEGTPDIIMSYHRQVREFFRKMTRDSKGRPLM